MNQKKTFQPGKVYRFRRFVNRAYGAFCSMHKVVNIGVLAGCVLTFAQVTETSAQSTLKTDESQKISEQELDEIIVTASRVEVLLEQSPKQITVISREQIQQAPIQSIQDLLQFASGIDVIQRGGHGVQADISMRGGSFDQTAILLNGVNLSNPQTGHYSFDIPINLNDIERIEIIHGPSSIVYGASAFSGGINIITRKNPNNTAYANIQAGGHKLFNIETGGSFKTNATTNQLSFGYSTSDGYIRNSDYNILNLLWQTRLKVDDARIDIQMGYNDKRYGANTFYSPSYPDQYDKTNSYLVSVRGETGQQLKFIPQVYWNRHNDCFQLFRDGTLNLPTWYVGHNYHRTDVYGSNLNLQYRSAIGITSLGAEFRNEGIVSNVLGKEMNEPDDRFTKSDNRTNISYALEHNVILKRLSVLVGILANYNTSIRGDYRFYPSLNTSYRVSDNFKVYASWNKATRMPTFTDLYYTTVTHIGNSDLKPENSEALEFGINYNRSYMKAYITGYSMTGKNMIDWVKENPEDKWESKNLTRINKKGVDVGAKFYLNEILAIFKPSSSIDIAYTRLHQDKSSNNLISNYALNYLRDKFTCQLTYPIHPNIIASWSFRWQKRMGTYLDYEDRETPQVKSFPAFSTSDLKINWTLQRFNLNLTANNIFDKKYFDLGSIPQAGFWLIGGVSYTIH